MDRIYSRILILDREERNTHGQGVLRFSDNTSRYTSNVSDSGIILWWQLGEEVMVLNVTIPVGQEQKDLPLGIRNNNPGNLRPYDGELYAGSSDIKDNFIIFDSAENGLRGLARDIQTKVKRKLNTIDSLTKVYAPKGDNNPTESYINTIVENLNSFFICACVFTQNNINIIKINLFMM
jgi:hypothetical protein